MASKSSPDLLNNFSRTASNCLRFFRIWFKPTLEFYRSLSAFLKPAPCLPQNFFTFAFDLHTDLFKICYRFFQICHRISSDLPQISITVLALLQNFFRSTCNFLNNCPNLLQISRNVSKYAANQLKIYARSAVMLQCLSRCFRAAPDLHKNFFRSA